MKFKDVFKEPIYNISNFLSILRASLLGPFWYLSDRYLENPVKERLIPIIFLIIMVLLSDFFDGFIARRFSQMTTLGSYLDPLCDKIATIGSLYTLTFDYSFPLWIFIIYIIREILGIWLGSFLFFRRDIKGKPNLWGKVGVTIIAFAVFWYICIPYLKTFLEASHFLITKPHITGYVLFMVLIGGIISYSKTHWQAVFLKNR